MKFLITSILIILSALLAGEQVDAGFEKYIHPHPAKNRVGKIEINDRSQSISESTWVYVKKALDYYKKDPPLFLIVELNTPGGEVFAAQKISDALKEMDTQWNVPVVAVINNWAISAGAMIAYSCRFIAVVKDSSMGAAEPIIQETGGEVKSASEKVNSAIRADFASRAKFFDRNPFIAEAMVDKDLIIVEREGKVIKLDTESQIRQEGPHPDKLISPKGKLLTLNADELIEFKVATIYLPPKKITPITPQEQERGVWPAEKEILFENPFFASIPNAEIDAYQMDWKTRVLAFLSLPAVSSLLLLGVMLGFYIEFNHPGWGAPGALALGCLILLILSSFALELANFMELILLGVGLAIIAVDLFLLPTFGLLGIIGLVFFVVGLFGLLLPGLDSFSFEYDTGTLNAAGETVVRRLGWFSGTFIVGAFLMALFARFYTPRPALFKRIVLEGNEQEGYLAAPLKGLPEMGALGESFSDLRPSGKGLFHEQVVDAFTRGRWIPKGVKIKVIGYEGGSVIVEEAME